VRPLRKRVRLPTLSVRRIFRPASTASIKTGTRQQGTRKVCVASAWVTYEILRTHEEKHSLNPANPRNYSVIDVRLSEMERWSVGGEPEICITHWSVDTTHAHDRHAPHRKCVPGREPQNMFRDRRRSMEGKVTLRTSAGDHENSSIVRGRPIVSKMDRTNMFPK
jgi:hypothetical protein